MQLPIWLIAILVISAVFTWYRVGLKIAAWVWFFKHSRV